MICPNCREDVPHLWNIRTFDGIKAPDEMMCELCIMVTQGDLIKRLRAGLEDPSKLNICPECTGIERRYEDLLNKLSEAATTPHPDTLRLEKLAKLLLTWDEDADCYWLFGHTKGNTPDDLRAYIDGLED